jgi:hypothetical protein
VEIGVEKNLDKNSLSRHADVSPKFRQKITGFKIWKRFGGSLKDPNIWYFEHLNRKTNYGSHPFDIRNYIPKGS